MVLGEDRAAVVPCYWVTLVCGLLVGLEVFDRRIPCLRSGFAIVREPEIDVYMPRVLIINRGSKLRAWPLPKNRWEQNGVLVDNPVLVRALLHEAVVGQIELEALDVVGKPPSGVDWLTLAACVELLVQDLELSFTTTQL